MRVHHDHARQSSQHRTVVQHPSSHTSASLMEVTVHSVAQSTLLSRSIMLGRESVLVDFRAYIAATFPTRFTAATGVFCVT